MAGKKINRGITLTWREDGIGLVVFDQPDSSANVFNQHALAELAGCIDEVEQKAGAKGLVFMSAKPSIFIAGADIKEILQPGLTREDLEKMVSRGQDVFQRIANLKLVTIAAIHGACLGGGFELCLACDYRLATPDKATKIGLPEISLGILPAWGGCSRMPRLVGFPKALDLVLAGKKLSAAKARKAGLVDQVIHREHLEAFAVRMIGKGKSRLPNRILTNNAVVSPVIAFFVRKQLRTKTRGHYPAPLRALEVMLKGVNQPVETGLALERKAILDLGATDTCRNLVRIFFLQERSKRLSIHDEARTNKIERVEVIGAGVMGAGIAQWAASRGYSVLLKDIGPEPLLKGMNTVSKLFYQGIKRGVFDKAEARRGQDRVVPVSDEVPLKQVDLVIEAAVEDMAIKKKIFADLAKKSRKGTILATNTSALSISELAESVPAPEQVIGIHFFNPVSRMPLVELVVGEKTSDATVESSLKFILKLGKMPVVVKDSPGFLVNRILIPYLIEAGNLFAHGASSREIDEAMLDFGMPMGPLRLIDEVGVDVASHVSDFFAETFEGRMPVPKLLGAMVEEGFLGRKAGKGFYQYGGKGNPTPNPALASHIHSQKYKDTSREELIKRMALLMVNESARCLEEGVVRDPRDVDFGMIMGTGFAPFRGGPLRYADKLGVTHVVDSLSRLAASEHPRFTPCELLVDMARNRMPFYAE